MTNATADPARAGDMERMYKALKDDRTDHVEHILKDNNDVGIINKNHLCLLYLEASNMLRSVNDVMTLMSSISKVRSHTDDRFHMDLQKETPIAQVIKNTIGYVNQSMVAWLSCRKYTKYIVTDSGGVNLRDIGNLIEHLLQDETMDIYKDNLELKNGVSLQDLFIWSILTDRRKMSEVLWRFGKNQLGEKKNARSSDGTGPTHDYKSLTVNSNTLDITSCCSERIPTGAALIGSSLLKALSVKADAYGELQLSQDLQDHASKYEAMSVGVVAECYHGDKIEAHRLLVRRMEAYGNKTLFSISDSYSIMSFMGTSCCQTKLRRLWKGHIDPYTPTWKMILCFFLPVLIPFMCFHEENKNVQSTIHKIRSFYTAPVVVFIAYAISYLVFLAFFMLFVLTDLHPNRVSIWEYITWGWVFTLVLDEIRQLLSINRGTLWFKARGWFGILWNRFDLAMYVIFVIAVIVRFIDRGDFGWARTIYSISLATFIIRIMQGFLVSKRIGPKVIVLGQMIKDVLLFVGVFLVFLVSFGVMYQANLYPNTPLSLGLLRSIVYIPYWQLYGELFLDEMNGDHDGTCSTDESALQNDGDHPRCPQQNMLVVLLAAIYLLMSNILLVNLLIAMFSTTYQKIHDRSELVWRFYCYGNVHTLYDYPLPCPPLNIPSLVYKLVRYICKKDDDNEISLQIDDPKLDEFETKACEEYLKKSKNSQTPLRGSSSDA